MPRTGRVGVTRVADPVSLHARLRGELPQMLALTSRLTEIDTPSNAPAIAEFAAGIAEVLTPVGFVVHSDGLRFELRRDGSGPRALVLGHSDTVWPDGTAAEWPVRVDGDLLSGPGVGDMKANVVMAAFALRALAEADALGPVRFLLVPDEELGSPDSRGWIEDVARESDVCLGLEPARPGGGIVTARGAVGAVILRASGVSAHTTEPDPVSALSALAPLVGSLEALSDRDAGTIVTAGILRGGSARQVVPEFAELHLDLRAADAVAADALLGALERTVARAQVAARAEIGMDGGWRRPPYTAEANRALLARAVSASEAVGLGAFEVHERGGSDVSFAGALGVPSLDSLGPITHESCSRRERVEVASIASRGAVLGALLSA
jgi:glutamate carboxypeptidase